MAVPVRHVLLVPRLGTTRARQTPLHDQLVVPVHVLGPVEGVVPLVPGPVVRPPVDVLDAVPAVPAVQRPYPAVRAVVVVVDVRTRLVLVVEEGRPLDGAGAVFLAAAPGRRGALILLAPAARGGGVDAAVVSGGVAAEGVVALRLRSVVGGLRPRVVPRDLAWGSGGTKAAAALAHTRADNFFEEASPPATPANSPVTKLLK